MDDFTIALVQHSSPVGHKQENLAAAVGWVRKAQKRGAQLVCLPELNLTGHAGHPAMVAQAEPVPDGACVRRLCEVACELDVYISAGIAEDERGIHYNTQFVVGPDGYVGKQRKVHLSRDEYFYFRHGTALPVLDLPMVRLGTVICYDNHFPEIARCLAIDGAELLVCPHAARFGAWPRSPAARRKAVAGVKDNWRLVHRCRAYDNGCYVALCNTAGRSAVGLRGVEANHAGGCLVVDPSGTVIAESHARDVRAEMVVASLAGRPVADRRAAACFNLQTRRPEVFAAITAPTA